MRSWKDTALNIVTIGVTLMAVAAGWTRFHRPLPQKPQMAKPTNVSDWREYARVGTRVGPLSAGGVCLGENQICNDVAPLGVCS
jgi:hypothetical protein